MNPTHVYPVDLSIMLTCHCTSHQVVKLLAGDSDAVCWAKSQLGVPGGDDDDGRHGCSAVISPEKNDIQSYINLALRDVIDDDASSVGSGVSLEEYLKGRWSRSSSFEG